MKLDLTLNLSTNRKIILASSLSLVWCLFCYYALFRPATNAIENERKAIYDSKVAMEQRYQRMLDLKKLNLKMKKVEPEMAALNGAFLSRDREIEFITSLENVATKNSVTQKISLGQRQVEAKSPFSQMPINIELYGTYENIMSCLIDLEHMNYYIAIKDLEFGSGGSSSGDQSVGRNGLRVTLNALTYWRE